jgi:putative ABC transport system permease protein
MRFLDLLRLIAENLGRRKGRVVLTAIGVVIGTASVVVLVSLAIGLQRSATQRLGGIGDLTQIQVYPNYGEMPVEMKVMSSGGGAAMATPAGQKMVTPDLLSQIAALPGVVQVIPRDYLQGGGMLKYGSLEGYGNIIGIGVSDLTDLGYKAQSGELKLEKGSAVIGTMVSRNFNNPRQRPGQQPPEPPDLMGQQIKLVLQRWSQDGVMSTKTVTLRVSGVIAESRNEPDYSIYLPLDEVTAYNEWFQSKRINRNRDGYNQAIVRVESVDKVLEIADQIKTIGLQAQTPQEYVQGINSFFIVLQVIFGGVGAVALLVAAIGIANTMAMAILERTREIGLMKAVGATNRDVLSIFLGEAAGIGLIGGLGGTLIGWGGGKIIDVLMISYLASQTAQQGGMPPGQSIATPVWLLIFGVVFATLVGLVSGLYPALRAATLVPVTALKYE